MWLQAIPCASCAKIRKDIFAGKIQTVLIWKLDRLARSIQDGVNILAEWCKRDVRIVSITQQIDLSGMIGQTVASLIFGLAEIELEHIRERQTAGIDVAKKLGIYKGRKKAQNPREILGGLKNCVRKI